MFLQNDKIFYGFGLPISMAHVDDAPYWQSDRVGLAKKAG